MVKKDLREEFLQLMVVVEGDHTLTEPLLNSFIKKNKLSRYTERKIAHIA